MCMMKPKRVLVCGGRYFRNRKLMDQILTKFVLGEKGRRVEIVNGGAPGADTLAEEWAAANSIDSEAFYADWEKHGRAAGPIRNREMLASGIDLVVAFPGGTGTADMVRRAKAAGVTVIEVNRQKEPAPEPPRVLRGL
jgi:hypothetical protein